MNLRRVKHTLLRLTAEEKVIGIAAIIMVIGTFLPWYSVTMNFDKKSLIETGFSGDMGVVGFVIFLMSLMSLLILVGENMHLHLPQFGYKREQILFFFLGQAFFLTLLTMAIYTKRSLEFTEAGLNFGIYTVLTAAFFGALSAFALIQKSKKKEVHELFLHNEADDKEKTETELKQTGFETEPKPMRFAEDAQLLHASKEEVKDKATDNIPEDDMIEEIQEIPQSQEGQGDYFTREAGVGSEKEKPKSGNNMSMNFYEDK